MKEQIVSLLEAGCRVRVSFLEGNRIATFYAYDDSIDRIITDRGNFWMPEEDRSKSLKIIEVIPPIPHKYREGDLVMWLEDEREGPFEVKRIPETTVLYIEWHKGFPFGHYAYLKDITICPYREGVTYNPLPTN